MARRRPSAWLVGGVIVAAGLVGAFMFGLIHIVGGTWRGNSAAVWFGVGLSIVTGILLVGLALLARRRQTERARDRQRSDR
jgi:protein-S-isoprenylcysteine O-methyltransferase Ste14